MDFESARKELQRLREDGIRDSERIVDIWYLCLSRSAYKLGDELWCVYEQVFTAAIDIGNDEVAQECLDGLSEKFPDSVRVQRLQGMHLESLDRFNDARNLYTKILEDDPTNMVIRKRLIAILKAEGKHTEVIKELKEYLEKFMSDVEAWSELCDLYLIECEFKKAAFCMEEVLLTNPHNHLYNQKYAEIKYTEGGQENLIIALSYFGQALTLNPDNVRALYGFFLTASRLSQNAKLSDRKTFVASADWAARELAKLYENTRELSATAALEDAPYYSTQYCDPTSRTARANGAANLSQELQKMSLLQNSRVPARRAAPPVVALDSTSSSSAEDVDLQDEDNDGSEAEEVKRSDGDSSSIEEDADELPTTRGPTKRHNAPNVFSSQ